MKYAEVRGMTKDELKDALLRVRKDLMNLRFQRATGQAEKPSRFREMRRDVARLLTRMREEGGV